MLQPLPLDPYGRFVPRPGARRPSPTELRRIHKAIGHIERGIKPRLVWAKASEASYGRQLRSIAKHIARIMEGHRPENGVWEPGTLARLEASLKAYGQAIEPWARATAWRMLSEAERKSRADWRAYTAGMSLALQAELATAPTGETLQGLLAEQVDLITSLPWDAAREVQEAALRGLETAARYPEREAEIRAALERVHPDWQERLIRNRATLIARTETARAASVLTQARAQHIGAEQYEWLTAGDWKVRESHRKLNHTIQRWDAPPLSDPPDHHSHPGQIFNCRCVALPIIPGA